MGTERISLNDDTKKPSVEKNDGLGDIIEEYEKLSEMQLQERQELLDRIDKITKEKGNLPRVDPKLDQFTTLLLDIRSQITGISNLTEEKKTRLKSLPKKSEIIATDSEIKSLSSEVHLRAERLDEEINSLTHLLSKKKSDISNKDRSIEELNDRLDLLTEEKTRLADELENINSIIDSWQNQLSLLRKLASSDPRYRVLETLKKHGNLSEIQLAFTMGTSINQLHKYLEDLIDLQLVKKSSDGRYSWSGKDIDNEL